MTAELIPHEVDLDSAGEDFWQRYHAFRRARHKEKRPDDPVVPDQIDQRRLLDGLKFEINDCYEVLHEGEMVAWLRFAITRPGAPGYEENRHFLWCTGSVLATYRRRGIARRWLPIVLERMDHYGCRVITFDADEESGHAFLKWLGAPVKGEGAENRLRTADLDWAMVQDWVKQGQARNPQTKMERYDDHIPDSMLEEFAPQLAALLNTMPWDDLEHGSIVETPETLRDVYRRMDAAGDKHYTILTREPDGVISGITDMAWITWRPKMLEQLFTGVLPSARGRGIGKWIKGAMLLWMRELYPEFEGVITGNADSNGPMLAINHRLGFKRHRGGAEYQLSRDELAARIEALKVKA